MISIGGTDLACVVKNVVNTSNFNSTFLSLRDMEEKTGCKVMLVSSVIAPSLVRSLANEHINVLDVSGNCSLNIPQLYINIIGQKTIKTVEAKTATLSDAAIKLIFYFLINKENIGKTYRMIASETGLSLGTVNGVVEELKRNNHILFVKKKRKLANWRQLLDEWQVAYNQRLKPKLFVKKFAFSNPAARKSWTSVVLPQGSQWGGESGAYLTDGYLRPEKLTIYTDADSLDFIKSRTFVPADNGDVLVYKRFFNEKEESNIVPKLLIYADLMGVADSRCREAALKLIENEN